MNKDYQQLERELAELRAGQSEILEILRGGRAFAPPIADPLGDRFFALQTEGLDGYKRELREQNKQRKKQLQAKGVRV